MTDAWFSEEGARMFAFFSLLACLSTVSPLAERGRLKAVVIGVWIAVMALAGAFLVAAGVAIYVEQPAHVARALSLTGVVMGAVFAATLPPLRRAYHEYELRKVAAADL